MMVPPSTMMASERVDRLGALKAVRRCLITLRWVVPRQNLMPRMVRRNRRSSLGAVILMRWRRTAKEEVLRLRREDEKAEDVDAVVADLKLEKLALEEKVAALNKEIVKTLGLQDTTDQLRAQHAELSEKVRRGAEAAVAEAERFRQSRQEWAEVVATQVYDSVSDWYAPRLRRLSEFVTQRDMVEAAVVRLQVDEALLVFVKKISGVDLDFDAVEERLRAKLAKSVADGDAIDEVDITDDDFVKPNSVSMLVVPGSPSHRNDDGAGSGAGPSASGVKSV
ncbi:unnamed protein product [Microthlaspi erraticum]|uniref:Uncharacterized protein n=1 Tax=Microthlaspi erraticum TaxID=1685480 RepID=A0A6D2HL05_9BRAS|nr:unnamed protein product [Microthlaspi erraticum]